MSHSSKLKSAKKCNLGKPKAKIKSFEKTSKGFEQQFTSLGQQSPLKIKGNLRDSKANSQQAPVHWLRKITKTKLSQAGPSWAMAK